MTTYIGTYVPIALSTGHYVCPFLKVAQNVAQSRPKRSPSRPKRCYLPPRVEFISKFWP
jgi:hypothetical protein